MMYFRQTEYRIYGVEDLVTVVNPTGREFNFKVHGVPHTIPADSTWRGLGYMADLAIEGLIKLLMAEDGDKGVLKINDENEQRTYFEKVYVSHKSPMEQETMDEAERQAKQVEQFASEEDVEKPEKVGVEEEFPELNKSVKKKNPRSEWTEEQRKEWGRKIAEAKRKKREQRDNQSP